jgi:SAM-dependent MidA family methyltransferase
VNRAIVGTKIRSPQGQLRTPLAEFLARQILKGGPITFADYMAACLYHPQFGYYTGPASGGRNDYFTSPSVQPIFGRLLASQFHEMWRLLDSPTDFLLVEAGAGAGMLASQILDYAAVRFPKFYQALQYVAVEISEPRRQLAAGRLQMHIAGHRARLHSEMPLEIPMGCIFSNELLDALPVHSIERRNGVLEDILVTCDAQGNLAKTAGGIFAPAINDYLATQNVILAKGQRAEAGLAAADWIAEAGSRLRRGFVLTIDYGYEAAELYGQRHRSGTLLAYRNHRIEENPFVAPGEQDLTAHVNFTALDLWGRRAALERMGLVFQSSFLLALARANDFDGLEDASMNEGQRFQARHNFTTLIHPDGMGETFRVLIQCKGISAPSLTGLRSF